jgi:hypothetical protein
LTFFLNLKYPELWFVNPEGRSLEFSSGKLEMAHTPYLGVLDYNFIGGKKAIFASNFYRYITI